MSAWLCNTRVSTSVVSQFRTNDFLPKACRGPFLERPEKFLHPEICSKISNLVITELFCSHILNMNRGFLYKRSRRLKLSVSRYNYHADPKSFREFRGTGHWPRWVVSKTRNGVTGNDVTA